MAASPGDRGAAEPRPSAIVAALTVFDSQAVFRAALPGAAGRIVLFRVRRGSRGVLLDLGS